LWKTLSKSGCRFGESLVTNGTYVELNHLAAIEWKSLTKHRLQTKTKMAGECYGPMKSAAEAATPISTGQSGEHPVLEDRFNPHYRPVGGGSGGSDKLRFSPQHMAV